MFNLFRPSHFKEIFNDIIGIKNKSANNIEHVKAAIDWLINAQEAVSNGGVSSHFHLRTGWGQAYPETTGYIIPTLFDYYHITREPSIRSRAIQMANWEISLQLKDGSFPGGTIGLTPKPTVFNTGQILFGLVRTYKETKKNVFKKSAEMAADWLVENQEDDGAWRKYLSPLTTNPVHTYNVRVAWSLLEVHSIADNKDYVISARKNLDWALTQQLANGWFKNNSFHANEDDALLHTICYATRGFLEAGIYLKKDYYIMAAEKSANALLKLQREDGSLFGRYNKEWHNTVKWSCLVGNAQMAIIWLRLYEIKKKESYLDAAKRINLYLKSTQNIISKNKRIRGGIKGSSPIYGKYFRFAYPNWAAKFFIDALLLEDKINKGFE